MEIKHDTPTKDEAIRRDAAAMVALLNSIKSGLEPFEVIYGSLKQTHGKKFEYHFAEALRSGGTRNE